MSTATANGKSAENVVPVESKLDDMVAQLTEQIAFARARRDLLKEELRETERLVERIDKAIKALAGHGPGRPSTSGKGPSSHAGPDTLELVEATIARMEVPLTIPKVAQEIPTRHESVVRTAVYMLRDQGRVRLVDQKGPRGSARYDLMPEVKAEHA